MTPIIFILVITMPVFINMQVVNGQTVDNQIETLRESLQEKVSLQALLDYCFQHADRPNPLQDLIDKGFLSPSFKGETCLSVRQMYNEVETRIREIEKILEPAYTECFWNPSKTIEECKSIFGKIK